MIRILFVSTILVSAATAAPAADTAAAEELYQSHCIQCHGPEVYTREDRKVSSLPGLERQVQRCELALGLKWFDEDIGAVTDYLNDQFYKFDD